MTPLKSSAIANIDYDDVQNTLSVTFQQGTVYTYNNVPKEVAQSLMRAESSGKYFHDVIRPNYVGAKQEEVR
jgi:hypothetical protein